MSNRTRIKYPGTTMRVGKVHINNMYIIYTFVDVGPLLVVQILGAVPLPVASSLAIEALSLRLGSSLGFFTEGATALPPFLKFPFFPLAFLKLVVLFTINT